MGLSFGTIQNGIFRQTKNLVFVSLFSYLAMFHKIYRYPKHRKMIIWGKLIIMCINFTLLDIDNTKPSHKSGAVYDSFIFNFFAGLSIVFPSGK